METLMERFAALDLRKNIYRKITLPHCSVLMLLGILHLAEMFLAYLWAHKAD